MLIQRSIHPDSFVARFAFRPLGSDFCNNIGTQKTVTPPLPEVCLLRCCRGNIVPAMFAISSMDLKRAMATNVRRARHERKLTQEELADRAGLSARYLGSIERAAVSASVTVLGRLAQALRIDACDLIRSPQRR